MGVSDWTPYAQAIKSKGVKGLMFYGDFQQLAKLEQVLTSIDYKLDWIDTNSNAYGDAVHRAGRHVAAEFQNNSLDLGGVCPLERQRRTRRPSSRGPVREVRPGRRS